jgi:hypothetical protein
MVGCETYGGFHLAMSMVHVVKSEMGISGLPPTFSRAIGEVCSQGGSALVMAWLPSAGGPLRVLECMAGHVLPALPCGTTFEGAIFAVVRRASRLSASRGPQKWPTALYGHVRGETPCPHYPLPNGWGKTLFAWRTLIRYLRERADIHWFSVPTVPLADRRDGEAEELVGAEN